MRIEGNSSLLDRQYFMVLLKMIAIISALTLAGNDDPDHHIHDDLLFRIQIGPSYTHTMLSIPALGDLAYSGWGVGFSLLFGGPIIPNLSLGAVINANSILNPKVSAKGYSTTFEDITHGMATFGGFINYYLPWNIFVMASPMVTLHSLEDSSTNSTIDSEWGFGLRLEAGKEWWISSNWGLGVSTYFIYSRNDLGDNENININIFNFGLMLSATYN